MIYGLHICLTADFSCDCRGSNGSRSKRVKILGKTAHGSRPVLGVNAMNAATLIMNAVNALKDTFPPEAGMGLAVTLTNPGVGPIAAETELVIGFRGASYTAMLDAERRLARTVYAAAAAIGAAVEMTDDPGYAPMRGDAALTALTKEALTELVGAEKVAFRDVRNPGGTDMGDVSNVIPCVHPYVCGSTGTTHSAAFMVTDPVRACVNAANVPASPVYDLGDVSRDEHFTVHRQMIRHIEHPVIGDVPYVNMPVRFSATPLVEPRPSASLGAHNEEVYESIGLSRGDLTELRKEGII